MITENFKGRFSSASLSAGACAAALLLCLGGPIGEAEAKRTCRPVPAGSEMASTVSAVNMSCKRARRIVRFATFHGQTAPRGWGFINPGGWEGLIVRRKQKKWVISHSYRVKPGMRAIYTVIYRGCTS